MGAIITDLTLFLRFPRHTIGINLLTSAGMHFESEVYSMHKPRNQASQKPVTLSAY